MSPATEPIRVALLEASHWHVPLYLGALDRPAVHVAAVSDPAPAARNAVAARFGCPAYADWRVLLERESFDFAFVFGVHAEMPCIAAALIGSGRPFALEKPCGVSAQEVAGLMQASRPDQFVAVPLIFRLGELLRLCRQEEGGHPGRYHHIGMRFLAGPIERYVRAGCPWMLDPQQAGGGCTINLMPHLIDFVTLLTGSPISSVSAQFGFSVAGRAAEDHAMLSLVCANGTLASLETSYSFPAGADAQREFSFTFSSDRAFIRSTEGGALVWQRGGGPAVLSPLRLETDGYYADFVTQTLRQFRAGEPPAAGLADALAVMRVIDAAYVSARAGGAPVSP